MASEIESETFSFVRSVNPAVQALERIVEEIASTAIPVLLVGESGTGKEVFAWHIHRQSARCDRPLVKIRCASLGADSLMDWLLSAKAAERDGQPAGTIFFDEVSEMDEVCQRNLLPALPDGNGFPRNTLLSARTIFSTCRDLEEEMRLGRFRRDLYYRINGICLRLPPLRERKEDIPALAETFLAKYAALFGRHRQSLSATTTRVLCDYSWPGNIRELENAIKNIVAIGDEQTAVASLVAHRTQPSPTPTTGKLSLKSAARLASFQAERELILKTLTRTHWNRKRAAQELQISYKSLLYKLKQIRIDDSELS